MAQLWMDSIDSAIELHKRSLNQFIARCTPVLRQFCGNDFSNLLLRYLCLSMRARLNRDLTETYRLGNRSQRFGGHQHDNLLAAERQLECSKVGQQ